MRKIALILSGSGHKDGSEITESVSAILALSQLGAKVSFFAPDQNIKTVNHINKSEDGTSRSSLIEAARITRGNIESLAKLNPSDFDGLIIPGGFGAAKNLCTWASAGARCEVLPELKTVIEKFYAESKPIGAICIAPVIIARVLGKHKITVTIGNDTETIKELQKTGAQHELCPVDDFITDRDNKIITTPAYMYDAKPHEVFKGISGLVRELVEMA